MVQTCVAYNCTNRASKNSVDVELRKSWVYAVKRKNFIPSKYSALCSNHFKESDFRFKIKGNSKLKEDAVPTIFDFPQHMLKNRILRENKRKSVESREKDEQTTCDDIPLESTSQTQCEPPIKKKRREPFLRFGDFKREDLQCPIKAERMWIAAQKKIKQLRNKINVMGKKNKRLQKKVVSLKDLVNHSKRSKKYLRTTP